MPELVAAQDDRILVEHGIFGLMDLDVEACPRPFPDGASSQSAAPGAIACASGVRAQTRRLR